MSSMRSVRYSQFGTPDVLEIKNIPRPRPKAGQALVEIRAIAINPFDSKLRQGSTGIDVALPITPGADFAGVITEVAHGITNLKKGDEVFGSAIVLNGGSGAMAEYAVANEASMALKPARSSFEEAAASVLVGVSALQALDQLDLSNNKKILIHGGAGGIGSMAIQYAKHLGAYVATTARAKDKDFVVKLGADEVIDYETQKFDEILKDYDAAYDTIGKDTFVRSFVILKPGGKIVSMIEKPNEELAKQYSITALQQFTKVNTDSLNKLRFYIDKGIIKPQIGKIFSLDQAQEAFRSLESGKVHGKIVVSIK